MRFIRIIDHDQVVLDPEQLGPRLEENIRLQVKRRFLNRLIPKYGFIKFVKVLSRGLGKVPNGVAFTGQVAFPVELELRVIRPTLEDELVARVIEVNAGVYLLARDEPVDVMIYRDQVEEVDHFDRIQVGDYIRCVTRSIETTPEGRFLIVGQLKDSTQPEGRFKLPSGLGRVRLNPTVSDAIPAGETELGFSDDLNSERDRIAEFQYPINGGGMKMWDLLRSMANPYELLDNQRYAGTPGKGRHPGTAALPEGSYPVSRQVVISRAYYKMWEMLHVFDLIDRERECRVLCLAEAPGGFIQAIWHYRQMYTPEEVQRNDKLWATTRRSTKKLASGEVFKIKDCVDWDDTPGHITLFRDHESQIHLDREFGADGICDLINPDNLFHIRDKQTYGQKMDLITADGGISVSENYNLQEQMNTDLFWGECLGALMNQAPGGSFVLKIYETTTQFTSDLLYWMASHYENTEIFKPLTSRPTNSERYVVFQGFLGVDPEELDLAVAKLQNFHQRKMEIEAERGESFMERKLYLHRLLDWSEVEASSRKSWESTLLRQSQHFISHSLASLNTALSYYPRTVRDEEARLSIKNNQRAVAISWCERLNVPHYDADLELDPLIVEMRRRGPPRETGSRAGSKAKSKAGSKTKSKRVPEDEGGGAAGGGETLELDDVTQMLSQFPDSSIVA